MTNSLQDNERTRIESLRLTTRPNTRSNTTPEKD